jgi:serine phosphatase RsbU (regulator of sigma subunit)
LTTPPLSGAGPSSARILLIEDDPGDALLVQELFSGSVDQFSFTWVKTVAEAVEAATESYDCALLDLGLPDAVGLGALSAILGANPTLAVVVLTGADDANSGALALRQGAQDFLTKGTVNQEALTRSIRYAVARRGAEETGRQLREAELGRAENARLERGLLAKPLLRGTSLKCVTRYQPGGGRALLGGDFFDAIELGDGTVRVVVGDVCGHGPDEAALGVQLRVAWRALVLADAAPDVTIRSLQRVLETERDNPEIFASVCDLELDPNLKAVRMRLAGHPSPLLIQGNEVQEIPVEARGPLLGVFEEAKWPMVVFTDGIVEGRDGGGDERFETAGLTRVALTSKGQTTSLEALADTLIKGAEQANGEPLRDDVALVLLSNASHWTM